MIASAFDQQYRATTFGEVGRQIGGADGEDLGNLLAIGPGMASGIKSIARGVNQLGGRAASSSGFVSGFGELAAQIAPGFVPCTD
jgi:hypothetical protein